MAPAERRRYDLRIVAPWGNGPRSTPAARRTTGSSSSANTGRLALVEATPSGYRERGSAQILEGKTWSMPALANGRLFLRSQSEIVSLDLRSR